MTAILYAKPGYEGCQIILQWTMPDVYTDVVLVRKEIRFPETITDGTEIVRTSSGTVWADINELTGPNIYYYTLFTNISGTHTYTNDSRAYTIALDTNYFKTWLYDHLPEDWHEYDREDSIDNEGVVYLTQTQSGTYNEYFNIGENGSKPYYSLERYLRNIGIQLDRSYQFLKFFRKSWNINTTPADYIKSYAKLVSARIHAGQTIDTQRHKVRSAVAIEALKGTITGIKNMIAEELESVVDYELNEIYDDIVYISDFDSGFIDLSLYHQHYERASGTEDFIVQLQDVGRVIGSDRFIIQVDESDFGLLTNPIDIVLTRLISFLEDYIPVSSTMLFDISGDVIEEATTVYEESLGGLTDDY